MKHQIFRLKEGYGQWKANCLMFTEEPEKELPKCYHHAFTTNRDHWDTCPSHLLEPVNLEVGEILVIIDDGPNSLGVRPAYLPQLDEQVTFDGFHDPEEPMFLRFQPVPAYRSFSITRFMKHGNATNKTCTCDIMVLMAKGCQCGGK